MSSLMSLCLKPVIFLWNVCIILISFVAQNGFDIFYMHWPVAMAYLASSYCFHIIIEGKPEFSSDLQGSGNGIYWWEIDLATMVNLMC